MSFFSSIKLFFYNTKLNRDAALLEKYKREAINLEKAKTIGILYDASIAEHIVVITKFKEFLKLKGIHVDSLAFINNKNKEENSPSYFNKLNLNWFEIPSGAQISSFQKKQHDILICATLESCLPIEYLAATSKAKFRIGPYVKDKTAIFDFMIDIKKHQNLDYFFNQLKHFLTNINT